MQWRWIPYYTTWIKQGLKREWRLGWGEETMRLTRPGCLSEYLQAGAIYPIWLIHSKRSGGWACASRTSRREGSIGTDRAQTYYKLSELIMT